MAHLHGKGGGITWSSANQVPSEILSWTLDYTVDLAEATPMNSTNNYKQRLVGHKDWTATATCYWDTADISLVTAVGTIATTLTLFMVATGQNIELPTSSALCTGLTVNTDMGDVITVTYTFVSAKDQAPTYGAS